MNRIELKGLNKITKYLRRLEQQYPTVRRNVINTMAFEERKLAIQSLRNKFILRNKYTINSIRVKSAGYSKTDYAQTGSTLGYMLNQEQGKADETITHIPTVEARVSKNKEKIVQLNRRLSKLNNLIKIKNSNPRLNFITIKQQSRLSNPSPMLMTINNRKAIFILEGKNRLRMLHDLSKKRVKIKRTGWFHETLPMLHSRAPGFLKRALEFYFNRK